METRLQQVTELFEQTQSDITDSIDNWKGYLHTASRLYKYSFDDQLLIHAQKSDATACVFMDQWNKKMNRWVNAGSKGIALIRKEQGHKPRLEYVFNVADTHAVRGGKTPWMSQMTQNYYESVIDRLEQLYGTVENADIGEKLMELAARATGERYREYLSNLSYDLEDSFLEGMDEINVDVHLRDAVTASVQYTLLTRCGMDASAYLDEDDFRVVIGFNTPDVLYHLGNALNKVSGEMLLEIGSAIRQAEKENLQKQLAKSQVADYNKENKDFSELTYESKTKRGNYNERIDIQQSRRLSDSKPDDGRGIGGTGGNIGQVRDASGNLSKGTQEWKLHEEEVVLAELIYN